MATKPLPPQDLLRNRLSYEADTGALIWRERPASNFPASRYPKDRLAKIWNGKFAGGPALASPMANGYLHGALDSVDYLQHRIIWKLITGVDPEHIDHINGVRDDNRLCNLRSVSVSGNMRNRRISSNNQSGVIGVYLEKKTGLWCASIEVDGVVIYLGRHVHIADAQAARVAAEIEHGFISRY
ncbi:HNH endonuclease signature motif containing protein [Sphingopyxis bauzanensis]|nr:HNH endonuclease signature motif containing protein [Sphingopyxis bauzanensis]GGJ39435.1 hypothetical protein GCM10011393_07040 [Sphingopyxis bauzanensis]